MYSLIKYCKIDIFWLNPVDDISYIEQVDQNDSVFFVYYDHFKRLVCSLFSRSKLQQRDILFYGTTINNQRSFTPLFNRLKHGYINIKSNDEYGINIYMIWSLLFVIPFIVSYFKADKKNKSKIKKHPAKYLLTYGKYVVARNLLKKVSPKILVLSNDHRNMNRCLLENAMSLGIKTVYIQHASVSNEFPHLLFDYSFLDGAVSFDAYGRTSKKGSVVILCGPCRYDYMGDYNTSDDEYIGLSLNEFDDFERVKKLCKELESIGQKKIKVRPHPSMGRWHEDWFTTNGVKFSVPAEESPAEYLCSLKMQISNVSGIHLDAAMLNIPSFYFQMSNSHIEDVFGFIRTGIAYPITDDDYVEEIVKKPQSYLPGVQSVRYHVASFKTELNFKVGGYIANILDKLLEEGWDSQTIEKCTPKEIVIYKF